MRGPYLTGLAAALAVLAGCSDGEEAQIAAPKVPGEVVATLPPGRPAVYAAALEGPEPFVRALYAVYAGPDGKLLEPMPPGRDPIYGRTLNAMIGAYATRGRGEVPMIDHDPICGCDQPDNLSLDTVLINDIGKAEAEAILLVTDGGETRRMRLKLLREGQSWRVVDVIASGEPPLTEQLLKVID